MRFLDSLLLFSILGIVAALPANPDELFPEDCAGELDLCLHGCPPESQAPQVSDEEHCHKAVLTSSSLTIFAMVIAMLHTINACTQATQATQTRGNLFRRAQRQHTLLRCTPIAVYIYIYICSFSSISTSRLHT